MLKKSEDKSLKPNRKIKRVGEAVLKRWHFHGEGTHKPQNVIAKDLQDATKIFNKTKKKLN